MGICQQKEREISVFRFHRAEFAVCIPDPIFINRVRLQLLQMHTAQFTVIRCGIFCYSIIFRISLLADFQFAFTFPDRFPANGCTVGGNLKNPGTVFDIIIRQIDRKFQKQFHVMTIFDLTGSLEFAGPLTQQIKTQSAVKFP